MLSGVWQGVTIVRFFVVWEITLISHITELQLASCLWFFLHDLQEQEQDWYVKFEWTCVRSSCRYLEMRSVGPTNAQLPSMRRACNCTASPIDFSKQTKEAETGKIKSLFLGWLIIYLSANSCFENYFHDIFLVATNQSCPVQFKSCSMQRHNNNFLCVKLKSSSRFEARRGHNSEWSN
jgi:hypothetical protein